MKKKILPLVCMLLSVLLICGCTKTDKSKGTGTQMYYVNTEGTELAQEAYEIKGDSIPEQVEHTLTDMKKEPDSIEYKSAFPKGLKAEGIDLEEGRLKLSFNAAYEEMDASSEVLFRAAVVKTLTQIAGVDSVGFFIGDAPLVNDEGEIIGYMRNEEFVQNTGSSLHSYQVAKLRLYYCNQRGDKLVPEEVSVRYNSNMSIERLIVEQIIKGPRAQGHQPAIPPETKVLGVSVKDGICYVNFDDSFLNSSYSIDPNLAVYALVNSLIEGGTASQVQISVNGETEVAYQGMVNLNKPFSQNLDIVEDTPES